MLFFDIMLNIFNMIYHNIIICMHAGKFSDNFGINLTFLNYNI